MEIVLEMAIESQSNRPPVIIERAIVKANMRDVIFMTTDNC